MAEKENLSERLDMLKGEVDTLRDAVMKPATPWYKNASSIVAISALLFSFGTTYVSYVHTRDQDLQALRTDLRSLLQRMAKLPKENLDIFKKYSDDPASAGQVSGYINQENLLLTGQAAEILKRLPADQVSSTEFQAVAAAMVQSHNTEGATSFYQQAIDLAVAEKSLDVELASRRGKANNLFTDGKPEEGRVEYQQALGVFERRARVDKFTLVAANIMTELNWAGDERNSGFADLARQHFSNAERLVATLPPSPGQTGLRARVRQGKSQLGFALPGDAVGDTGANADEFAGASPGQFASASTGQFAGGNPAGATGANSARRRPLPRWLSWLRR